jgi:hypothetical protein
VPDSIDDYTYDDFILEGYAHQGRLKGEVSAQGTPGQGVDIQSLTS